MRAFSIAMAASITVIIASQLGLPVSSTHIAIGGVFGVGFLREYIKANYNIQDIVDEQEIIDDEKKLLKALNSELTDLQALKKPTQVNYQRIVKLFEMIGEEEKSLKSAKKDLKKTQKVQLVKRDAMKKILAAWVITVPAAAFLSAILFFMIKGIML